MRKEQVELEEVVARAKSITSENFVEVVNAAFDLADDWDAVKQALWRESNRTLQAIGVDDEITERDLAEPARIEEDMKKDTAADDFEKQQVGSLMAQYFQSHLYAEKTMKALCLSLEFAIEQIRQLKEENQKLMRELKEKESVAGKPVEEKTRTVFVKEKPSFSELERKLLNRFAVKDVFYWEDLVEGLEEDEKAIVGNLLSRLLSLGVVSAKQEKWTHVSNKGIPCEIQRYQYSTDLAALNALVSLDLEEFDAE